MIMKAFRFYNLKTLVFIFLDCKLSKSIKNIKSNVYLQAYNNLIFVFTTKLNYFETKYKNLIKNINFKI